MVRPQMALTVLVVEDSGMTRRVVRITLEREGFVVLEADCGARALEIARQKQVDVVLLDLMLPDVHGFDLALGIRAVQPAASLVAFSALVHEIDPERFAAVQFDDVVAKPVDPATLIRAIRGRGPAPARTSEPAPAGALAIELSKRCSRLSAELAVITTVSDAITQQEDLDGALDEVLRVCFDAGDVLVGALHLFGGAEGSTTRVIGASSEPLSSLLAELALSTIAEPAVLAASSHGHQATDQILAAVGAPVAVLVPLTTADERLGVLLAAPRAADHVMIEWFTFVQAVASQLVHTLVLRRAFEARRRAESSAQEQNAEWRALLEQAPDLVFGTDDSGRVRFANRALGELSVEAMIGRACFELFGEEHRARLEGQLHDMLRDGMVRTCEVSREEEGRGLVWYSLHLGPVTRAGFITGAILIARDVSSKRRAEAQLMLADRMVAVGTLAAGVAHEANSPLAAIMANVQVAVDWLSSLDERVVPGVGATIEALKDATSAAGRLKQVVSDLKVFSHAEDEQRVLVDVDHLVDSVLRAAGNAIRHRAKLVKKLGGVSPVMANEARLAQVLLSLVMNAVEALPEGRADKNEIRVETWVGDGGRVLVEVRDTGPGIAPDVLSRIFTPFFTTKQVGEGAGLGLSLSQRIVSALGGEISVESEVGVGSRFRVSLPAAERPARESRGPAAAETGRRGRVLVVDDEPMIGRAMKRALGAEHDIVAVAHASEALGMLREGERFHVVFCDLMMPDMTGMDFHSELERLAPDLVPSVIYLTGGAFTPRARQFLDDVPNERMEKPFDIKQVRALVRERVGS